MVLKSVNYVLKIILNNNIGNIGIIYRVLQIGICDALQEKVTYVGKRNFTVERKMIGNLKKLKFQVLMDICSRYV